MVRRTTRVRRATSNLDTESFTSSRTTPPSNDKDEGYQPGVNPITVPPTTGADSYYSYDPSDTTTPALISYSGMCDNVYSTLPGQPRELLPGDMGSSTQRLPSTICPALLQPTLQESISLPKKNTDRRRSAAAKGKGKALREDKFYSGQRPTDLGPLDDEDLFYPSPQFSVSRGAPSNCQHFTAQLPVNRRMGCTYSAHPTGLCQ